VSGERRCAPPATLPGRIAALVARSFSILIASIRIDHIDPAATAAETTTENGGSSMSATERGRRIRVERIGTGAGRYALISLAKVAPLLVLSMLLSAGSPHHSLGAERTAPLRTVPGLSQKPNIVVITTDDQTLADFSKRTMPRTYRAFVPGGTTFANAIVASPSCCPSRAAYLSGQYPHNNGVYSNKPGYARLRGKANVLPTWLSRAGYRTAHVGKFLNHYSSHGAGLAPAPGWSEWFTLSTPDYYDYRVSANGVPREYGTRSREYVTRVLQRHALRFLRRGLDAAEPLYLQLDQIAPHAENGSTGGRCDETAVPDRRDRMRFRRIDLPQVNLPRGKRSFNEADVSDKSAFMRRQPRLGHSKVRQIRNSYRCRLASLVAVDRGVQQIVRLLKRKHQLDETVMVFTSDNGYFSGEHRIDDNKGLPYEEALRVPLLIRLPPGKEYVRGGRSSTPVSNIDLAPTILQLAGARPCARKHACRVLDGRSLLPLMSRHRPAWASDRYLLAEQMKGPLCRPWGTAWNGVRTWIEYNPVGSGCRTVSETYDLRRDPMELENLLRVDRSRPLTDDERFLRGRLHSLRRCAGIAGRDPKPSSGNFCG